jgi:hypothetical protein
LVLVESVMPMGNLLKVK